MFINKDGAILERGGKFGGVSFGSNASDESYIEHGFYPIDSETGREFAGFEFLKSQKMDELKVLFNEKSERPIITTSLGFDIQAGYQDLANFNVGLELGSTSIRAHDNKNYEVTDEEFSQVVFEIKANGAAMLNNKWRLEDLIKGAETEEDLNSIDITEGW